MMNNDMRNTLNDMTKRPLTTYELGNLAHNLDRLEDIRSSRLSLLEILILAPISFVILYLVNLILF